MLPEAAFVTELLRRSFGALVLDQMPSTSRFAGVKEGKEIKYIVQGRKNKDRFTIEHYAGCVSVSCVCSAFVLLKFRNGTGADSVRRAPF